MNTLRSSTTWSAAVAIFSLFFGSGNTVFPLALGRDMAGSIGPALVGLLLTAVGMPLLGLLAGAIYKGDCRALFGASGRVVGGLFLIVGIFLVGPTGVMARCVIVAHEACRGLFPFLPLPLFSALFIGMGLFAGLRPGRMFDVIGKVLSPLLLLCLLAMVVRGILGDHTGSSQPAEAFMAGLVVGYDTLDLMASLLFSAAIWQMLRGLRQEGGHVCMRQLVVAGTLAMLMLAVVYTGLTLAAANHSAALEGLPREQLLPKLGLLLLGPQLAAIANITVLLACLTTVLGLGATIAQMFADGLVGRKWPYRPTFALAMVVTALFANAGFEGIQGIVHPLAQLCYPALMVFTVALLLRHWLEHHWVQVQTALALAMTVVIWWFA